MLFVIIQYIISLPIPPGKYSQEESHTLVYLERFSYSWTHGPWAEGKWLSASKQEKPPRACSRSLSLPSWSSTNPAASSKLCLKSLGTTGSSTCNWKNPYFVISKLQEDPSTEMDSYEGIKLHVLPENSSLTMGIWPVWVQHSKIDSLLTLKLWQSFIFHKAIFPCSATQKRTWCC